MSTPIKYFLLFLFFFSCSPSQRLGNRNLSSIYKKEKFNINSEFVVFNNSDSVSSLYYKINTNELLFKKDENSNSFKGSLELNYTIFDQSSKKAIYSDIKNINNIKQEEKHFTLIDSITLLIPSGFKYIIEIKLTDVHRKNSSIYFMNIDKKNRNSRDNFLIIDPSTEIPLFRNHIKENELFKIRTSLATTNLFSNFYNRTFPISAPPFASNSKLNFNFKPDSIFSLFHSELDNYISFNTKGFYHLQLDTTSKEGITLYVVNENFPDLKTIQDLINPLVYITSKDEFEKLTNATDPKKALDDFWLKNAGSPERARELISAYYNRVREANLYFTSYIEGWKTDRGMIYIVFGPANILYRNTFSEIWIYGEENNLMSINYNFSKLENPFSDNDYELDRGPLYKTNWYQAVDTWRQGRVY